MIEVDPASLLGDWLLLVEDEPEGLSSSILTFSATHVSEKGNVLAPYTIKGAELRFFTRRADPDTGEWRTAYTFNLPGPLTTPGSTNLFGTEIAAFDLLSGSVETVNSVGFGEDLEIGMSCALRRQ